MKSKKREKNRRRITEETDAFWKAAETGQNRRDLLKKYAGVRVFAKKGWYRERRAKSLKMPLAKTRCFVCGAEASHRHHIIQLQHGGSNNPRNMVWLCAFHHADVHPWLRAPELGPDTSFWTKPAGL